MTNGIQNCSVALIDRPISINRSQQAQNIFAPEPLRHRLIGPKSRRHDPRSEIRPAPAAYFCKQEERFQSLLVVVLVRRIQVFRSCSAAAASSMSVIRRALRGPPLQPAKSRIGGGAAVFAYCLRGKPRSSRIHVSKIATFA